MIIFNFYDREKLMRKQFKYNIFITYTFRLCVGNFLSLVPSTQQREKEMKQLELDYQAHNYTDTSKSAWANKKDKLTKREQVFEYIKLVSSTNYEIADELNMPLSSVTARCRELQILNLVEDSGKRRETPYGKTAIVWKSK